VTAPDGAASHAAEHEKAREKMITIVCQSCGSEEVFLDAYAQWSVDAQDWELCSTYDHAWCAICDGETRPVEKEIE